MPSTATPHIALIAPPSNCVEDDRLEPPLGLLYLASVLKENGYVDIEIVDLSGCGSEAEIADALERVPAADVYGITLVCSNHDYAKRCVQRARSAAPKAYIVAGGANATALPEFTLADLKVDAVVTGEGEDCFLDLVRRYTAGAPAKGIFRGAGRAEIDSYPFPARELVDLASYRKKLCGQASTSLISTRGCPFHCMHCNSTIMGGGSKGYRCRSAVNVAKEIEALIAAGIRAYRFCDDNFSANPHVFSLLERLADYRICFRIFARIEHLTEKFCRALRRAGCVHVFVGVESLNPENLRALGKAVQIGLASRIDCAAAEGLTVRATFMVGLPFDTNDTIERYFSEAARLPFAEFEIYPLVPFPGTRLAAHPERWGYRIIENDFRKYILIGKQRAATFALAHKTFSAEDVRRWRERAGEILRGRGKIFFKDSPIAP